MASWMYQLSALARFRINHRVPCLICAFAMASSAAAADLSSPDEPAFRPSISVGTLYVDNLYLVPPGMPTTSDEVGEIVPRIQLTEATPRLTAAVDYSAQGLLFLDHSGLDAVHNDAVANGLWTVDPNLFYVTGRASYLQQPVDPTLPTNQNNLFGVGNSANVFNAMISPYFKRDFGSTTGSLGYAESITHYSDDASTPGANFLQNSRTGVVSGKVAENQQDAFYTWDIDGRDAHTDFASASPLVDDRIEANNGFRVLSSLKIIATVGAETNILTHSTTGGLDAGLWSSGFKWAPNPQTSVAASVGHRFYGPDFSFKWVQETRLLKVHVDYREDVTDAGQSDALIDFVPGIITVNPQVTNDALHSFSTYQPYRVKELSAQFEVSAHLTEIALQIYDQHRRYLDIANEGVEPVYAGSDSTHGGELVLTRILGPLDTLKFAGKLDAGTEIGFDYRDYRYQLSYIRRLSRKLDLFFSAVHLNREGTIGYRANICEVKLEETF
jgi:uncharacterized protein (PEP-CTERM system associated)